MRSSKPLPKISLKEARLRWPRLSELTPCSGKASAALT